jgi:hypothetical protein
MVIFFNQGFDDFALVWRRQFRPAVISELASCNTSSADSLLIFRKSTSAAFDVFVSLLLGRPSLNPLLHLTKMDKNIKNGFRLCWDRRFYQRHEIFALCKRAISVAQSGLK